MLKIHVCPHINYLFLATKKLVAINEENWQIGKAVLVLVKPSCTSLYYIALCLLVLGQILHVSPKISNTVSQVWWQLVGQANNRL